MTDTLTPVTIFVQHELLQLEAGRERSDLFQQILVAVMYMFEKLEQ